jgi:O-antigen/teichoic acid export membrane protein
MARDIARDHRQARRYLVNVIGLRTLLWLASLPIIFLAGLAYHAGGKMSPQEAQAIAIFVGALLFSNIADAISSVFVAFEQMEYPAALATATTVGKVALSALILLPPFSMGFVGLTVISLLMNIAQVIWLYVVLDRRVLSKATEERAPEPAAEAETLAAAPIAQGAAARPASGRASLDWKLQRVMLVESTPLMINHLLATVFWRISQFVLRGAATAAALGIFSVGVKYLDGLNIIPSYFTMAIFPLMSRYAYAGGESLVKAYRLAVQLLVIVALPIAVFMCFAASPLVQLAGGTAYLPDGATALSIMIWSIPIGFVNSVTQYALIAVNQQRFLTKAFLIGVVFTTAANLLLVPRYGYVAASAILILAEASLCIPFGWAMNHYVAPIPWLSLVGRPIFGTLLNIAVILGLERIGTPLPVAIIAGFVAYLTILLALGTFRSPDFAVLRSRLPQLRLHRAQA